MAKRTHKIRKALTDGRRTVIVQAIAEIARSDWRSGITETLMNHEGTMIATLRATMCLEGIGWRGAHEAAIEIVGEGLTRAGAKRPRWKEGQPEWTDGGVIRNQRLRCANCEGLLEPEQRTFCCKTCFDAHRARQRYHDNIDAMHVINRVRSLKRAQHV